MPKFPQSQSMQGWLDKQNLIHNLYFLAGETQSLFKNGEGDWMVDGPGCLCACFLLFISKSIDESI